METHDELADYLAALDRDACYRVDATLKEGSVETTERVFFVGENGSELGPFVRKRIRGGSGLGGAYEEVFDAQLAGVRLAHLPRLLECHRRDGDLVVVMELVPGETLDGRVEACGTRDERLGLVARTFPDLCDAVIELHERLSPPVIHRDLKPDNVIVSSGGVTLIDLGISRAYRSGAEQDTTHFGTRTYAPPEQFGFGQTGVTSDVYALGMLLFFCVTGREPTQRDRESGFGDADVPEALRAVVSRATNLDPSARYASVRDLKAAVAAAVGREDGVAGASVTGTIALGPQATQQAPDTQQTPTSPPESFSYDPYESHPSLLVRLLSRVPVPLGIIWDVLVIGATMLVVGGCIEAFRNPTGGNVAYPAWYLAFSYLICMVGLVLIACYLLLDRRPVRRLIPRLAGLTVREETTMGLIAMAVIVLAWIAVTMFAPI